MHEDNFWESLTRGAGVFRVLVIVIVIALIIYVILRVVMPIVNDRRTRNILIAGMSDEGEPTEPPADSNGAREGPGPKDDRG